MKKTTTFICLLFLLTFVYGCQKEIQPDSPSNTATLLNHSLFHNDYDRFLALFSEGRKEYVSEELFDELVHIKNRSSGGLQFRNYELLIFDNGEMVLVNLTPKRDGKVEIQDIIFVPEDMQDLFKTNLTKKLRND